MNSDTLQYEPVENSVALAKRLKDLEQENRRSRRLIEKLQDALCQAERRCGPLADHIPDVIFSLDKNGTILTVNKAVSSYGFTPQELVGRSFAELIHQMDRSSVVKTFEKMLHRKNDHKRTQQFRIITKTGKVRWFEVNGTVCFTRDGRSILQVGVCRDITESMRQQQLLIKNQADLQKQVKIRTSELLQVNAELQKQINEHWCTEKALREREAELKKEKANLEETTTALQVLLKHREEDKQELEAQVLCNIRELVVPYLGKLKKNATTDRQKAYIQILESNINDVTGSFLRKLSLNFYGLTASQLKVANFIRQGKKTREIAEITGLSTRTIETYRQGIRRKLNLANKKVNLRTFLLSMDWE